MRKYFEFYKPTFSLANPTAGISTVMPVLKILVPLLTGECSFSLRWHLNLYLIVENVGCRVNLATSPLAHCAGTRQSDLCAYRHSSCDRHRFSQHAHKTSFEESSAFKDSSGFTPDEGWHLKFVEQFAMQVLHFRSFSLHSLDIFFSISAWRPIWNRSVNKGVFSTQYMLLCSDNNAFGACLV